MIYALSFEFIIDFSLVKMMRHDCSLVYKACCYFSVLGHVVSRVFVGCCCVFRGLGSCVFCFMLAFLFCLCFVGVCFAFLCCCLGVVVCCQVLFDVVIVVFVLVRLS